MKQPHEMNASKIEAELAELDGKFFALLQDYEQQRKSGESRDTATTVEQILQRRIALLMQLDLLNQEPVRAAN